MIDKALVNKVINSNILKQKQIYEIFRYPGRLSLTILSILGVDDIISFNPKNIINKFYMSFKDDKLDTIFNKFEKHFGLEFCEQAFVIFISYLTAGVMLYSFDKVSSTKLVESSIVKPKYKQIIIRYLSKILNSKAELFKLRITINEKGKINIKQQNKLFRNNRKIKLLTIGVIIGFYAALKIISDESGITEKVSNNVLLKSSIIFIKTYKSNIAFIISAILIIWTAFVKNKIPSED